LKIPRKKLTAGVKSAPKRATNEQDPIALERILVGIDSVVPENIEFNLVNTANISI
jgi:hypothetical protein